MINRADIHINRGKVFLHSNLCSSFRNAKNTYKKISTTTQKKNVKRFQKKKLFQVKSFFSREYSLTMD